MSTNCLVTKLKGSVNNDSLKYYGEFDMIGLDISSSDSGFIRVLGLNGCRVIIEDGVAYAENARTTLLGSEFTITSDNFYFVLSDGNPVVKFVDGAVYKCTRIAVGGRQNAGVRLDVSDLAYSISGLILATYASPIIGNIDNLSKRENGSIVLSKLAPNIFDVRVSGDLVNLSKFDLDANGQSGDLGFNLINADLHGDVSVFGTPAFNHLKEKMTLISTNSNNVGKMYGNVEAFKDYTNMVRFDLNYIELTGNLATALGSMVNLNLIAVGGHNEAEDLKDLFDALYANGKVSGSIQIWVGKNKTCNGTPWVNGDYVTFSASGWSVA